MATPYWAMTLSNIQTTMSGFRSILAGIRPLYNIATTLSGRAVAPAGVPTAVPAGLFGFGLLGYTPLTLSQLQFLTKLQSLAQTGIRAPAGFSLQY